MTERPNMLSVYDGQHIRGFVLSRGKAGHEAFSADERSLGLFRNPVEAADAICADAEKANEGSA
jgi:hypothetical protein